MRRRLALTGLVVALLVGLTAPSIAAPLDPDKSFGRDGRARWGPYGYTWGSALVVEHQRVHTASTGSDTSDSAFLKLTTNGKHGPLLNYRYIGLRSSAYPGITDLLLTKAKGLVVVGLATSYSEPTPNGESHLDVNNPYALAVDRRLHPRDWAPGKGRGTASYLPFGSMSYVVGGDLDRHGRVVIVGAKGGDIVIARLRRNGAPDESFAPGGMRRIVTPHRTERPTEMSLDRQGRILVAGKNVRDGKHYENFVARFRNNGLPSLGWARLGLRHFASSAWTPSELVVRPSGRILVGFSSKHRDRVRITQLTPYGNADFRSFTRNAKVSAHCVAPQHARTLSDLIVDNRKTKGRTITAIMWCMRHGKRALLAAGWDGRGNPRTGFGRHGVGRLPFQSDFIAGDDSRGGQLVLLYQDFLSRIGG